MYEQKPVFLCQEMEILKDNFNYDVIMTPLREGRAKLDVCTLRSFGVVSRQRHTKTERIALNNNPLILFEFVNIL